MGGRGGNSIALVGNFFIGYQMSSVSTVSDPRHPDPREMVGEMM